MNYFREASGTKATQADQDSNPGLQRHSLSHLGYRVQIVQGKKDLFLETIIFMGVWPFIYKLSCEMDTWFLNFESGI